MSPKGFLLWTEWTETLLRNPLSPIIAIGHQLRSETINWIWMTCADTYDGQQICNAHRDSWPDSSDDISLRFTLTHPDEPKESYRTFICPLKNVHSFGEVCEGEWRRSHSPGFRVHIFLLLSLYLLLSKLWVEELEQEDESIGRERRGRAESPELRGGTMNSWAMTGKMKELDEGEL